MISRRHLLFILTPLLLSGALLYSKSGRKDEPPGPSSLPLDSHSPDNFAERYTILIERNIFSKSRRSPAQRSREEKERERERERSRERSGGAPEDSYVLTGTLKRGYVTLAFIENVTSGVTVRIKEGEPFAGGTVTRIALDSVDFEVGGRSKTIEVGRTLTGGLATLRSSSPPSSSPSSGPPRGGADFRPPRGDAPSPSAPAIAPAAATTPVDAAPLPASEGTKPDESGGDIIERMRRKRLEEAAK